MKEFLNNHQTYLGDDYRPWSQLLLETAVKNDVPPANVLHDFLEKYSLFDSTILLYQLLAAAKGTQLPLHPELKGLEDFHADLNKLLIAVYRSYRMPVPPPNRLGRKEKYPS